MPNLVDAIKGDCEFDTVTLPVARYRLTFRVTETIHFPEYAGSMIRGAFGRALRKIACMTRQSDCKSCPLYRSCPYTAIFETPPPEGEALQKFSQIPNAYVIEPPVWGKRAVEVGEELTFGFILFGRARDQLALVIYALQRAFHFDVGHGKADLLAVHRVDLNTDGKTADQLIYTREMERVAAHDQTTTLSIPKTDSVTIRVMTPMRIQKNGRPLGPEDLTPRAVLMTLIRRVTLLSFYQNGESIELDYTALARETDGVDMVVDMGWKDWTRYSSRQKQTMSLGGVVGTIKFKNLSPLMRIFLTVGTLTHIGKNASFGMGQYVIE